MSHPEQSIDYSAHEHNVEGAALLLQGRDQEAIFSFTKGLKSTLRYLQHKGFSNPANTEPLTLTGITVTLSADHSKHAIRSSPCLASNCNNDDVFILFNYTLILEESESVSRWNENSYGSLMLAVTLYNMGLAMHLGGLKHGDSQKLLEAMRVYFMAYASLQDLKRRLLNDEDNAFGLVLLALMNNMAHIQAHFRRITEASQWIDEMRIQLSVYLKPHTNFMVDADCGTFFLNVCFFERNRWPAPAA